MEQHDKPITGSAIRDGIYTTPQSVLTALSGLTVYDYQLGTSGWLARMTDGPMDHIPDAGKMVNP